MIRSIATFVSGAHIRALACSCLLSLSVASGSTAHLLRTTAAMLMSPRSYAGELVVMPGTAQESPFYISLSHKKRALY